jgi:hypothetical protein
MASCVTRKSRKPWISTNRKTVRKLGQGKVNSIPKCFGRNGGDDETRTLDLCRDSGLLKGFTTTYKTAGTAKGHLSC